MGKYRKDFRALRTEVAAMRRDMEALASEVRLLRRGRMDGLINDMRRSAREMLRLSRGL